MNEERILSVLIAPRVSEKVQTIGDHHNQYAFRVVPDATRAEVARAVEKIFSVKVERVNILNVRGKVRARLRGRTSHKPNWKKAYVTVQAGSHIEFGG